MPFRRFTPRGAVLAQVLLVSLWWSPCASHGKKHAHLRSLVVTGSQGNVSLTPPFHPKGLEYDAGVVPGGFLVLHMDLFSNVPVRQLPQLDSPPLLCPPVVMSSCLSSFI